MSDLVMKFGRYANKGGEGGRGRARGRWERVSPLPAEFC